MDIETKMELVKAAPTEELINDKDMREIFQNYEHPNHYIGYEVSGFLHIGSLIVSGFKINDLAKAGVNVQAYFAHWHSLINNKLGGDFDKIKAASKYYDEAFRFFCPKLKTVQATELYKDNSDYWFKVLQVAKELTVKRNLRCMPILGRSSKDNLSTAQYFYPVMQAADIKEMDIQIAHAGLDQRSVQVLAREIFPKVGWKKPVILHHHLIPGLAEPEQPGDSTASKMSKSKPWTCIFIHDSERDIHKKMNKAWCPADKAEGNPVLEMARYVAFHESKVMKIERPKKFGGDIEFENYGQLEKAFLSGDLHPADLKGGVASEINKIIKPVREHFEKLKYAKLLDVYNDLKITR